MLQPHWSSEVWGNSLKGAWRGTRGRCRCRLHRMRWLLLGSRFVCARSCTSEVAAPISLAHVSHFYHPVWAQLRRTPPCRWKSKRRRNSLAATTVNSASQSENFDMIHTHAHSSTVHVVPERSKLSKKMRSTDTFFPWQRRFLSFFSFFLSFFLFFLSVCRSINCGATKPKLKGVAEQRLHKLVHSTRSLFFL